VVTAWILIIVFSVLVLVLVVALMLPTKIKISSNSIRIGRGLAIEVPFQNIEDVLLKNQYPRTISRVHGFDSGDVKRGIFETPDGRRIRLHMYLEYPPFIEVIHQGGLLVFNTPNSEKTEQLYQQLKGKVEKYKFGITI